VKLTLEVKKNGDIMRANIDVSADAFCSPQTQLIFHNLYRSKAQ